MNHGKDETVAVRGKLRSVLILLFSTSWLIALVTEWVIPHFGGGKSAATKVMERIRWSTGTRQRWDMFQTIPTLRSYRVELIGETISGEQRRFGPIVPELEVFDGRQAVRYYYAFNRIFNGNQRFLDGYIAQVTKSLHKLDPEVKRFSIHIVTQPTRLLERSRKDGNLWTTDSKQLGPYPMNDD